VSSLILSLIEVTHFAEASFTKEEDFKNPIITLSYRIFETEFLTSGIMNLRIISLTTTVEI